MDVNGMTGYDIPIMTTPPAPVTPAAATTPVAPAAAATPAVKTTADSTGIEATNKPDDTAKDKQSSEQPPKEYVEKTIEQINKSISTFNREMHISVHKKTQRIMVKVMDTEENKVIRELPPEKVLDAFARTLELAGILVDKKG